MMLNRLERTKRLLIVDELGHSRDSLTTYLQLQEDLEVVGETACAAEAVRLTQRWQPDVVIMDINLLDEDGFTATRKIVALPKPPVVILLTVHRRLKDVLRAQEAGAAACIEKSAGVDAIIEALRTLSKTNAKEN